MIYLKDNSGKKDRTLSGVKFNGGYASLHETYRARADFIMRYYNVSELSEEEFETENAVGSVSENAVGSVSENAVGSVSENAVGSVSENAVDYDEEDE